MLPPKSSVKHRVVRCTLEHLQPVGRRGDPNHVHFGEANACSAAFDRAHPYIPSVSIGTCSTGTFALLLIARALEGVHADTGHYAVEPLKTNLSGLVALVTGGGRGLGSAIALNLASSGAAVVVHYSKSGDSADAVVKSINESGGRAHALRADLSTTSGCKSLVRQANAVLGKVDILVSNAGQGNATPIEQTTDEEWDAIFNINVHATMALMRELLPQMRARQFGRVVTISSIVGIYGTRGGDNAGGGATYAASKAALIAFTKGIAHEGSPFITANVVVPGPTNPEPSHNRPKDPTVAEDGSVRWLGMKYLSGRMGVAEDVANATAFLHQDRCGPH